MWRYSKVPNFDVEIITKLYMNNLPGENDDLRINFSKEGVYYICDLVWPIIDQINNIHTSQELIQYVKNIPYNEIHTERGYSLTNSEKFIILDTILYLLLLDNRTNLKIVYDINPWSIFKYINSDENLKIFFKPHNVCIDTKFNNKLCVSRNIILGIMAVYRYLHINHPFSMYGSNLPRESELVNGIALSSYKRNDNDWYNVSVGDDIYDFKNIEFFQGLMTWSLWNNIDPHTFITNLKRWVYVPPFDKINHYAIDLDYWKHLII